MAKKKGKEGEPSKKSGPPPKESSRTGFANFISVIAFVVSFAALTVSVIALFPQQPYIVMTDSVVDLNKIGDEYVLSMEMNLVNAGERTASNVFNYVYPIFKSACDKFYTVETDPTFTGDYFAPKTASTFTAENRWVGEAQLAYIAIVTVYKDEIPILHRFTNDDAHNYLRAHGSGVNLEFYRNIFGMEQKERIDLAIEASSGKTIQQEECNGAIFTVESRPS